MRVSVFRPARASGLQGNSGCANTELLTAIRCQQKILRPQRLRDRKHRDLHAKATKNSSRPTRWVWTRVPFAATQITAALQESRGGDIDPEAVTKKYGLEAGVFNAFKNSGAASAKDLLKKYGSAYLVTSITLALISFSLCYIAVDAGVDVPTLLGRFGLAVDADSAWDKGGTVALAYAAHKALSPVRFPPTVALTPVVAQRFGRRGDASKATGGETSHDEA